VIFFREELQALPFRKDEFFFMALFSVHEEGPAAGTLEWMGPSGQPVTLEEILHTFPPQHKKPHALPTTFSGMSPCLQSSGGNLEEEFASLR